MKLTILFVLYYSEDNIDFTVFNSSFILKFAFKCFVLKQRQIDYNVFVL